ncbi:hypothetical protein [Mailhella sp.]
MELKDFVAQTLTQICEGIQNAREATKKSGAIIAPPVDSSTGAIASNKGPKPAQMVHFEILLEGQAESGKEGGVKVAGGFISLGGNASSAQSAANTHKVSFDVPLVWPEL